MTVNGCFRTPYLIRSFFEIQFFFFRLRSSLQCTSEIILLVNLNLMTDINGDKIVSSVPFAFHNSKVVPLHGSCIHFANSKASESSVSRTPIITTDSVAKSKSLLFDSSIRTESSSNSRSSNINITDRELKTATLNSHSPSGEFVIIDEDVGSSNPYHERCIPSLPVLSALDKARETTILKLYVKLMFEDRARILDLIHREFGARVCSSVFLGTSLPFCFCHAFYA